MTRTLRFLLAFFGSAMAAIATVAFLLLTAYFCLRTLLPGSASAPGVDELRRDWLRWTEKQGRGKTLGLIADSYLMVNDMKDDFPVGDAYAEADRPWWRT